MDCRVGGIVELARHPAALAQAGEDLLRAGDRGLHPLRTLGQDHPGAQRSEEIPALERHRVRHREDAAVAARRGDVRQPDAGIAAGRLHDHHPLAQPALLDRIVDHGGADAVLDRVIRVVALVLHHDAPGQSFADSVEPDERRVADRLRDVLVDFPVRHAGLGGERNDSWAVKATITH
jgi:hypothetical protein